MMLFTKDIDKKLFQQYDMGSNLEKQKVIAKIFNPYGNGRWFLINSDPNDSNYLWAIVQMGDTVEVGSVSRQDLISARVGRFRFPLERDLGFSPVKAAELFRGLNQGKFYADGGETEVEEEQTVTRGFYEDEPYEYAKGGEVKWQDARIGDSARVKSENKMGIIKKDYGRKFHLKFVDGTEKTYDASELEFIKDEDEYSDGGMMANGGAVEKYNLSFNYNPSNLSNEDAEKIVEKYTKDWKHNNDFDSVSFYVMGLSKSDSDDLKKELKMEDTYNIEIDKSNYAKGGMTDYNVLSTEELKELVYKERQKKIKNWYKLGERVVVGRNDGYWYMTSPKDSESILASNPSQKKIIDIIKNNPSVTEIHFNGTIKVGQRVGQELEIVDDFDVLLWEKGGENFKIGTVFEFVYDDGKYINKIVDKNNTETYKDRFDDGKYLYFTILDKKNKTKGEARYKKDIFKEMIDSKEIIIKDNSEYMSMGGKVTFDDKVSSIKKSLLKTKKVSPKVQKDYGKTYNKKEALESAKRIAGAMKAKYKK